MIDANDTINKCVHDLLHSVLQRDQSDIFILALSACLIKTKESILKLELFLVN